MKKSVDSKQRGQPEPSLLISAPWKALFFFIPHIRFKKPVPFSVFQGPVVKETNGRPKKNVGKVIFN